MDLLIILHRRLQKFVDCVGMRPLAQCVFRYLLARRYPAEQLARATQNGREWWLAPEVALRGAMAEFETIEWLREVVRPGMTVFDVGANVGQMTLEMAHLVGPAGRVVAIEPAPGNVRLLKRHVEANGFINRVTIVEAACSDAPGQDMEFVIFGEGAHAVGSGHQLRSSRTDQIDAARVVVKVKTLTVDSICAELALLPQVIKIDVEGAEAAVLQGARTTLRAAYPVVRFGFHPFAFDNPAKAASAISTFMDAIGFEPALDLPCEQWALAEYVFSPKNHRK